MKIKTHITNETKIAEVISEDTIIKNSDDGLDLLGNLYYQGFDKILIHEKTFQPNFLTLKLELREKYFKNFPRIVSIWLLLGTSINTQAKDYMNSFMRATKANISILQLQQQKH